MNLKRTTILGGLAAAISISVTLAEAQSVVDLGRDFTGAGGAASGSGSGLRITLVIAITLIGFGLGWLMTEKAREARQVVVFILAALLLGSVLIFDGLLGWSFTLIAALLGFLTAMGWWARRNLSGFWTAPKTFGSSRWATTDDVSKEEAFGTDGIRIGKFKNTAGEMEWVSYKGDRHLLTVAPTRAGKGTTQIIPNLLTYEGSALVIDPKGENAFSTAEARHKMGQEIHIVDPWAITPLDDLQVSAFNPLDWLDTTDPDLPENAMLLASALVVEGNSKDPFWDEEAKALLQGLIMHVATDAEEDGKRYLPRVRELLVQKQSELDKTFAKMEKSLHPIVSSTGARSLQKEEKLKASVIATAQAHTHFLDSDRIRMNMMTSSFKFEDLKTKPTTIYLVLPADRLNTFGRWLRLLVQQAITVNARNIETKPEKSILFVLDEFAALGRLTMVEQAYGIMAGYGMQLWGIVQDFNQLDRIYDKGWQSFVSNSGMINYFGSSDKMTAEYFSSLCGETTDWSFSNAVSRTFSESGNSSSTSDTSTPAQRKLAFPDELMRFPQTHQIVFLENMHPLRATKVRWYEDTELKALGRSMHD